MNAVQALNNFWSGFGIPAYDETSVPDDAHMPYLTYETITDDFGNSVASTVSLFYRSSSWFLPSAKATEIENTISKGGKIVRFDDGAFWIVKGSPFSQRMKDGNDDSVRVIIINVMIEFIK